jgi:4-hydroxy-tetrahydrodipicolinate reductase
MRLAVVGASGRMGRSVVRLARGAGIDVVCAIGATDMGRDAGELAGIGAIGTPVVDGLAALERSRADVVIDFSAPNVVLSLAPVVASLGIPLVTGTTGLGEEEVNVLNQAAKRVALLWEPNMSFGVHVLTRLVAQAVAALEDFDIEIIETHHRAKVDAPSGTALRLVETAQRARASATRVVHGRKGIPGARTAEEIGVHALRGGDIVGDHVVLLMGTGERLELVHRATTRDLFASGALRAASWIVGRPPGRYTLGDVVAGIKP